jgi:hypothetical protein
MSEHPHNNVDDRSKQNGSGNRSCSRGVRQPNSEVMMEQREAEQDVLLLLIARQKKEKR